MQDFRDGYVALSLRDEEGVGRSVVVRRDEGFGKALSLLTSDNDFRVVEIEINADLEVVSAHEADTAT